MKFRLLLALPLLFPLVTPQHIEAQTISSIPQDTVTSFISQKPQSNFPDMGANYVKTVKEPAEKAEADRVAAAQALLEAQAVIYTTVISQPVYGAINGYTACAGYVKSRRPDIPNNWGNAGNWYYAAQSMGWATGSTPQAGAIAWLKGGNHVAYVESVSGDQIYISEANFNGNPNPTSRWDSMYNWLYIY